MSNCLFFRRLFEERFSGFDSMSGQSSILSKSVPFVLSLSKDGERMFQQPAACRVSVIVGLLFLLVHPSGLLAQELLRAGTIFSATQAPLWAAKEGRFFEKYGIKNLEVISSPAASR
jgi:hypothetical protein